MTTDATNPTLWHAIAHASLVVKLVITILVGLSITAWTFIIQRSLYLRDMQQQTRAFEDQFFSSSNLNELSQSIEINQNLQSGLPAIFQAGFNEFNQLQHRANISMEHLIETTNTAMRNAQRHEIEAMEKHLPFLATVGSTSPYIGLFGTVWGIMNAFQALGALGDSQTASIAMVAPGISEALITTALGLFAAIPAVIAYNRCTTQVDQMTSRYEGFREAFSSILLRQGHEPAASVGMAT